MVEDEDATRLMLDGGLSWAGYRIRAAASADEATAVLDGTFEPDVVLTDMSMPGGSGLGLANALREHPGSADLPVIFLSGRALPGDVVAGRSLGATYLSKPCSLADLARAIDEAAGTTTEELEDVVRRRLGDVAGVEEEDAERALTATLLRTFVASAPIGMAAVERAVATADAVALEMAAHRLAGGAATLGADALAAAFRSLEDRALNGEVVDADDVRRTAEQLARTCRLFTGLAEELEEDVLVHDEPFPAG